MGDVSIDMEHRDPNDLNYHVKTNFAEVIGEPDGGHSADCVWVNSNKCFFIGKNICYKILTFICAIPMAFCWGCEFACLTFCHIWHVTPCYRVFAINLSCAAKFWSAIIHCYCDPCYEAMALSLTKIFFNQVQNAKPFEDKTYEGFDEFKKKGKERKYGEDPADHYSNA